MELPQPSRLRRFAADRSANVAIIFGLGLLPMLGATAIAVDYSMGLAIKSKLDTAADAAAIAGITAAKNFLQSYTGTSNVISQAITAAQNAATAQFTANAAFLGPGAIPNLTMSFTVVGGMISGTVGYSYNNPTHFASILGVKNITIANNVTSVLTAKTYAQVYIILDNSESMGIGATWTDQCNLYNLTGGYEITQGETAGTCTNTTVGSTPSGSGTQDFNRGNLSIACVLACHTAPDPNNSNAPTVNTELMANCASSPSITLRLDVAKQAIVDALNILPTDGSVLVSVYRLSDALDLVIGPTSNFASVQSAVVGSGASSVCGVSNPTLAQLQAATGVQLGSAYTTSSSSILPSGVGQNKTEGGTNITGSLNALYSSGQVTASGNGFSSGSPLKYMVLVTDSVEDNELGAFTLPSLPTSQSQFGGYYSSNWSVNWTLGEINTSACANFTNPSSSNGLGWQMFALYVDYVIPPVNSAGTTSQIAAGGPNVPEAFQTPLHDQSFPLMFTYIGNNLIPPAANPLQTCAGASNYFSANSPAQIESAMQKIFQGIVQSAARLTWNPPT
ncbi:MAG TPA: pilus assembly protein TadG-related protein [Methylocystis sp.]|nr:pilus assembly protein TadG-related protein [Methylocystis sp.]